MKKIFSILTILALTAVLYPAIGDPLVSLGIVSLVGFAGYKAIGNTSNLAFNTLIPAIQAMGVFTDSIIAHYQEDIPVKGFLRSFFPSHFNQSKYISLAVRRGTEFIASDVYRYSDGNRNTFSKASLKEYMPPFFHEYMDMSNHALYDNMIMAVMSGNAGVARALVESMAKDFIELRKKIERRAELMCAQVLQTGIVTLDSGEDIDFKRKAASKVAYSSGINFADGANDPSEIIKVGCEFIRTQGKADAATFNLIMGDSVLPALLNNTIIKGRNDIKSYTLDKIQSPFLSTNGAAFHGELTCGAYTVRLWTYPENYESSLGTFTNYIDTKKIILLPSDTVGTLEYALVPQLLLDGRIPQTGEYLIQEEIKEIEALHRLNIKSTVVPVPVKVDQIWTATVLS